MCLMSCPLLQNSQIVVGSSLRGIVAGSPGSSPRATLRDFISGLCQLLTFSPSAFSSKRRAHRERAWHAARQCRGKFRPVAGSGGSGRLEDSLYSGARFSGLRINSRCFSMAERGGEWREGYACG
jgi:hypothetical protein